MAKKVFEGDTLTHTGYDERLPQPPRRAVRYLAPAPVRHA